MSCANWMFAFRRLLALPALIAFFAICQITQFTGVANAAPPVAVTITLTIIAPNGTTRVLSTDDFTKLPQNKLQTNTAWTEGPQNFDGVLLRDVLATVGVDGKMQPAIRSRCWRSTITASAFRWKTPINTTSLLHTR